MKRRVLAILCVLSILMGMVVMPATAATATPETEQATTYQVGYAIKNFNPWVSSDFDVSTDVGTAVFLEDPENTANKKIYPSLFSQNGNQTDWESVVTELYDDNGDGNVDHNDGIFATCTAVTYGEKTVLFITTDTMKAWTNLVNAVRDKIVASDWGQELGITADEIMVCSNHTHSGPQLDGTFDYHIDTSVFDSPEKQTALKTDRETYFNWVVDRIVAAAAESVTDQAPATMSKGAVDATDATAAKGYNSGNGYHMNTIRHYERTLSSSIWGIWEGEVSSIYANTAVPSHDKLVAQLKEYDHEAKDVFNYSSSYTTSWSTTDEADNTMYVLRFEFEDTAKDPVVFVNWRAHSTMNSGVNQHSLSGDYAVSLRKVLGDNNYRAAFFQGAAGNVVPAPMESVYTVNSKLQKDKMDWLYEATNKASSPTLDETTKTFVYGRMLAEVAQYCMEETDANGNSYMVDTPVGEIKTYQTAWKAEKQKYSDDLLNAAIALRAEVMSTNGWDLAEFENNYRTEFQSKSSTYFPYYYKISGETKAIINSRLHFNTVYTQAKTVKDSGKSVAGYTGAVELDAIMLGNNVAFITSPNELADYYHDFAADNDVVSHTSADKEAHNDWYKLIDEETYGTPFLLGYSNQNSGYIANWLDHKANSSDYSTITGLGADGYMLYSPGTYESMTSDFAAGQGEALIDIYDQMLDVAAEGNVEGTCPKCGSVEWVPLTAVSTSVTDFGSGHYYLTEDMPRMVDEQTQKIINTGDVLCINLNGYTMETEGRSFNVASNGEVSIINTALKNAGSTGIVRSYSEGNNPGGGTVTVASGGIFNLYGGTMEFVKEDDATYGTGVGGIFSLTGTLNMYGGTIEGAELVDSSYVFSNDGCGGAIYMYGGAKLNVYGGEITSGTLPTANDLPTKGATLTAAGPCVYVSASNAHVKLYNNANVEDIFFRERNAENFTISGTYTGTTNLSFHSGISLNQNLDIGNVASGADISGATLTCSNQKADGVNWEVRASGTNLVLYGYDDSTYAVIVDGTSETEYTSLSAAVNAYTSNGSNYIKLIKAPTDTAVVTISKDTYLDLNGNDVDTAIDASAAPLYVMDSMTDDYNVNDSYGYGKLTSANNSGTIEGVPVDSKVAADGYLKVTEIAGVSFHRVNLQINYMVLRPRDTAQDPEGVYNPDVYYKITEGFSADSVVAGLVDSYGIAMLADDGDSSNGEEIPTADTLNDLNHSKYTGFTAGKGKNTGAGTLLTDVLQESNNVLINRRNANIAVYGRAYIEIDGQYMFGGHRKQTLKGLVQEINLDTYWNALTADNKEDLVNLYKTYSSIFGSWGLTNVEAEMESEEYNSLKVLVVGNSHGLDATNLLYEVFEAQKNSEGKYVAITEDGEERAYDNIVIGALYHSSYNMNQHAAAANDTANYSYHKISSGTAAGTAWQLDVETCDDSMYYGLQDEEWDIVVMQTMNHRSGITGTSEDNTSFNQASYKAVADYIMKNCKNGVQPKLAWHMIWTNPDDAQFFDSTDTAQTLYTHPTYRDGTNTSWVDNHNAWYGTDGRYVQSNMYDAIVNALQTKILSDNYFGYDIDYVLPSATAVQYAQDILGCTDAQMYRDWTHMSDFGRLMVAYTWWAELMGYDSIGVDIIGNIPTALSSDETGKNAYPAKNTDSKYIVDGDMKSIITKSVNYALSVNDPTFADANAYQIVEDDSIAILGIGNSYTMDCMWMLPQIYAAENPGKAVKLGIAYISGGNLQDHASGKALGYFNYWDSTTGTWQYIYDMTLDDAIAYADWDLVSLQQGSTKSVDASTYNEDIQTIQGKVTNILGYTPEFFWNQTWTWSLTHASVGTTEVQTQRFEKIISAVQQKIVPDRTFSMIMPVGVAVQNAIPHVADSDLFCDTVHLGAYGRLIAGYVLYCQLENVASDALTTLKVTKTPADFSKIHGDETQIAVSHTDEQMRIALEAVRNALITGRDCTFASTDLTDLISG